MVALNKIDAWENWFVKTATYQFMKIAE